MDLDKTNNNVNNLEWSTHKEQTKHYHDTNKQQFKRYNEEDILALIKLKEAGCSHDKMSKITGISTGHIGRILNMHTKWNYFFDR